MSPPLSSVTIRENFGNRCGSLSAGMPLHGRLHKRPYAGRPLGAHVDRWRLGATGWLLWRSSCRTLAIRGLSAMARADPVGGSLAASAGCRRSQECSWHHPPGMPGHTRTRYQPGEIMCSQGAQQGTAGRRRATRDTCGRPRSWPTAVRDGLVVEDSRRVCRSVLRQGRSLSSVPQRCCLPSDQLTEPLCASLGIATTCRAPPSTPRAPATCGSVATCAGGSAAWSRRAARIGDPQVA